MDPLHIWNGNDTAETTKDWANHHLGQSRKCIADLLSVSGVRTVENTLRPYDRALWHLSTAGRQTYVMFMVHPSAPVRDSGQELSQLISAEGVALSLNQEVYRALSQVDAAAEDERTRYYLERILLGYRIAGVDRDEATREKVRALSEHMTQLSMAFSRRVQDDVRRISLDDANELLGLPQDYLERKNITLEDPNDKQQLSSLSAITITTDPPDMSPVMNYAHSSALRRRIFLAYNDRAFPENKQVLLDLLAARQELAEVLGFRSYADLATTDQMMGSAENMRRFLGEVEEAARELANTEFEELQAFVRERDPKALPLTLSDARYWEEQYRRAHYDFDSQSVRPYFPYAAVEAGILATAGKLFGVEFRQTLDAPVWDASVKAFDVVDQTSRRGEIIGKIYLDMHPREGKSKWFSECSLVGGVFGERLPEASLVCNFPEPKDGDSGLMQYNDVVTYFHEFGHLMHEILGGAQRWAGQSGIATEGDFVEVPSQMLEEFFEDADLLRTFAKHYETGEPIPYDVVERMTRASAHGRALSTLAQLLYANYSLETHDRKASELDLDVLLQDGYRRFSRYAFVEGNRMYAAFTHLIGYTSNYYTYMYDKVMALEFFSEFGHAEKGASIGGETARRYRREVLEPGGSKPARELVQAFLGREVSMNALKTWIRKSAAA